MTVWKNMLLFELSISFSNLEGEINAASLNFFCDFLRRKIGCGRIFKTLTIIFSYNSLLMFSSENSILDKTYTLHTLFKNTMYYA